METTKLESTILNVARQTLLEFNSYAADGLLDEALVRYHAISALTMLGKLQDSGLSHSVEIELDKIDQEAIRTLSDVTNIKRSAANEQHGKSNINKLVPPFTFAYKKPGDDTTDLI